MLSVVYSNKHFVYICVHFMKLHYWLVNSNTASNSYKGTVSESICYILEAFRVMQAIPCAWPARINDGLYWGFNFFDLPPAPPCSRRKRIYTSHSFSSLDCLKVFWENKYSKLILLLGRFYIHRIRPVPEPVASCLYIQYTCISHLYAAI